MPPRKKQLEWANVARDEFLEGLMQIADESPANAALVQSRIEKSLNLLRSQPLMGKPGVVAGTRDHAVPNTPFSLIYEDRPTSLFILHCWHQRRDR